MASTGTTSRRSPTSPARRPPGTPRSTSPPARRSRRTVTNPPRCAVTCTSTRSSRARCTPSANRASRTNSGTPSAWRRCTRSDMPRSSSRSAGSRCSSARSSRSGDPILEKVVGATLVLLGAWVLYSVVQYARGRGEFRMRSRWMLVFDVARDAWDRVQARIHGHEHTPSAHSTQYGPRTAFGVGMIHGVGAETGSQALLLAGVAGVTGVTGVVILLAFVVGLLISNTLVAVVSASGFIGAQRLRTVYVIVGAVAGLASLLIGFVFISGFGTELPDLQELIFGKS